MPESSTYGVSADRGSLRVYLRALERLGWNAADTLFIDDLFANVQGARRAGLHTDSVRDARALGRVLRLHNIT